MAEFLGARFNQRVGQFDHLSKTNLSYQNFQKLKVREKKKKYLRGALDSAQNHHMRKVTIQH